MIASTSGSVWLLERMRVCGEGMEAMEGRETKGREGEGSEGRGRKGKGMDGRSLPDCKRGIRMSEMVGTLED